MFTNSKIGAKARLWLSLALFAGLAVAGWSAWALASADKPAHDVWQEKAVPPSQAGGASAPLEPDADALARYDQACLQPASKRLYRQALQECTAFTREPALAGRAHATLAGLYATSSHRDLPRSVAHARQAAQLEDPRGRFVLASHMLAGQAGAWDAAEARSLLAEAQEGGVAAAGMYLQQLDAQEACRAGRTLMPLGLPLFCMFRAEVIAQLEAKGMRPRVQDEALWRDELRPGALLTASTAELTFDMKPSEQLYRLARLRYVFIDDVSAGRWRDLKDSLTGKYGAARILSADHEALWAVGDDTVVRLRRDAAQLTVDYEHPERLKQRERHLSQVTESARQDALMAEAHVL